MHLALKRFKQFKQQFRPARIAAAFLIAHLLIGASACGKRKPPLPPKERVTQTVEIDGVQVGNEIRIIWQMPARNAADSSILNIRRADVYRLAEPLSASLSLTEEQFATRSTLIGSVSISDEDFGLKRKSFTDVLRFAGQPVRLRYAIRFVNSQGQKAAFSNFLLIEPTARVANPPGVIEAAVTQEAVIISWSPPAVNVDGSAPANIIGYNIYRRIASDQLKRLNDDAVHTGVSFADRFFEFGEKYEYLVRTVSLGVNAEQLESLDSQSVDVSPVDTFPPAPPAALTIAAAPNVISIFFAANTEGDIAGYDVYRSTDPSIPVGNWELLTDERIEVTTFQDKAVVTGVTYYYYVTATDIRGNVSPPSEVVSDTAF